MAITVEYTHAFSRTSSASSEAKAFYDQGGLGGRKADKAVIKNQRGTSSLWHSWGTDMVEHITVMYKYLGKHVTTKHVYRRSKK